MAGSRFLYRLPRQNRERSRRAGHRPRLRTRDARHLSFGMDRATGTVTVVLSGELDLTSAPSLAAHLEQVLAGQPRRLVFDMTRVGFLDCAAARLIAGTRPSLPDSRRPILRAPGPEAVRVLDLTGLTADCEIQDGRAHRDRFTMP
jgi:anti-sigma B factor antagonist